MNNPRRIFLFFVVGFLLGDILGVTEELIVYSVLSFFIFFLLWDRKWRLCLLLFSFGMSIGYTLGVWAYARKIETYRTVVQFTHNFTEKKIIEGTIEKKLYNKERTAVYLLKMNNFDNFDNFDKNPFKTIPELVAGVKNYWPLSLFDTKEMTIFVEIPSNLDVKIEDILQFEEKIKQNIHFPLTGYDSYAFFQGGYGYVFLANFTKINPTKSSGIVLFREKWESIFEKSFPREVAGTSLGMTIGSTKFLTEEVKESFLGSGITHILVVSGSNIAFVILLISFFLKYFHIRRIGRILIVVGFIFLYALLVGFEVPVIRATIMGVLSYMIAVYGGRVSGRALIGLTFFILTVFEPLSPLYDAGFGLSFGATLGILLFQKHSENTLVRWHFPKILRESLALTLGATLGSLPILLFYFGKIPLISIITNVLVAGFLGGILLGSIVFGFLSLIGIPLLKYIGLLLYIPIKLIIGISELCKNGTVFTLPVEFQTHVSVFLIGILVYFYLFDDVVLDTK